MYHRLKVLEYPMLAENSVFKIDIWLMMYSYFSAILSHYNQHPHPLITPTILYYI